MNHIALFGNCQARSLEALLKAVIPGSLVTRISVVEATAPAAQDLFDSARWIVGQEFAGTKTKLLEYSDKFVKIPNVIFRGYHPDCVYVRDRSLRSPIVYHSLIVTAGYLLGLKEDDTVKLFNSRIFRKLNYNLAFEQEVARFKKNLAVANFDSNLIDAWITRGPFMYSINHPKIFVLDALVRAAFSLRGVKATGIDSAEVIDDPLRSGAVFPCYFDISSGRTREPDGIVFKSGAGKIYSLAEFVKACYEIYSAPDIQSDQLYHPFFENGGLEELSEIFSYDIALQKNQSNQKHPYKGKPDHCFWLKSIANVSPSEVDPVVGSRIKITPSQKLATAGSCFAQHISKRLSKLGFNYYNVEPGPSALTESERFEQGYGVFSARYGNVYTTRQLLQLFDRAFGEFSPSIEPWVRPDGKYVDPFRPQVTPSGFLSPQEVIEDQLVHLKAVKKMFESMDVFVFTLGLTECWQHIDDGAILPLAPGVVAGSLDWSKYSFVNLKKDEVKADLVSFISKLRSVNTNVQIILTVSPVPLMATYEDRHVLVSTTASKSILRVVAGEVSDEYEFIHYFPSYEIIVGNFNRGSYFESDLREIRSEGVDHVMRLFIQHCTDAKAMQSESEQHLTGGRGFFSNVGLDEVAEIICDEEKLHV